MANYNIAKDSPTTWKPGQSGNPAGKPPGAKNFTTKVREALEKIADGEQDTTNEQLFIKAILEKAIVQKDPSIQRLMWNYLDGMPSQHIDHTTGGEKITGGTFTDEEKRLYESVKIQRRVLPPIEFSSTEGESPDIRDGQSDTERESGDDGIQRPRISEGTIRGLESDSSSNQVQSNRVEHVSDTEDIVGGEA